MQNLHDLDVAAKNLPRMVCSVKLDAVVCSASRPEIGVLILRDESGAELLELGALPQQFKPGDRVHIECSRALLRQRGIGLELGAEPVVDNDGAHSLGKSEGSITLRPGIYPIRIDWYNCLLDYRLDLAVTAPDGSELPLVRSNLQASASGSFRNVFDITNAECREGYWECVPYYETELLTRSGKVPKLSLDYMTRTSMVALRFNGTFSPTVAGEYHFTLSSDDGALLFIGNPHVEVSLLSSQGSPQTAREAFAGEDVGTNFTAGWITVKGRVQYANTQGGGISLLLASGAGRIQVQLLDTGGIDSARLTHRLVKISGLGRPINSNVDHPVLGEIIMASSGDFQICDETVSEKDSSIPLLTAEAVQRLSPDEALQKRQVHIRGVVTSSSGHIYKGFTLQDETRGIYVDMRSIPNAKVPSNGDFCDLQGHTGPGDFAPVVVAENVDVLGSGLMPEPLQVGWSQFINGSIDSQWSEFRAVVSDVKDDTLTLLLPEGKIEAVLDRYSETELKKLAGAQLRLRAVLFASWDSVTREVKPGRLTLRNANVEIETPGPKDPFDAPLKSVRELLQFDVKSSSLERIRVKGLVLHSENDELFMMDQTSAIRVIRLDQDTFRAGDMIEAVGYPELGGLSPLVHDAHVRKIGTNSMPAPVSLEANDLLREGLDGMLVRIEGRLVGSHFERGSLVLELQKGVRVFQARLPKGLKDAASYQSGSILSVTGVYAGQGGKRWEERKADSFDLLLNQVSDIRVVSTPPWWTLSRLFILLGALLVILMLFLIWIHQLRRQVDIRTRQLKVEIRERESAEREIVLETERARIARDLHDDLGSSLTEISMMASSGQRTGIESPGSPELFRIISQKARKLVMALDIIVWAVDPEANSLQSLADYLSGYVADYLSTSGLKCRFKVPVSFPRILLDGRVRHDLFLAVKEALHNVVQHAQAHEAEFKMSFENETLEISVKDDGRGFESGVNFEGHGLKNLESRLSDIGGICVISSSQGNGTEILIKLPLRANETRKV